MKANRILTALAVAVAASAQPALAGFQFTQNEKGEVTHYNGILLPPIQTIEEAKAQAQKEIAAAKKAREAQQAVGSTAENLQSAIGNQQFFFTGKPYLEETGQYLFLFRHYDPELARWTTADPSGFPDGANNFVYAPIPTVEIDPDGFRKTVVWAVIQVDGWEGADIAHQVSLFKSYLQNLDRQSSGTSRPTHYLDDGDIFKAKTVNSFADAAAIGTNFFGGKSKDLQVYLAAHGTTSNPHLFWDGSISLSKSDVLALSPYIVDVHGCNPVQGTIDGATLVNAFKPSTKSFLYE